MRALRLVALAWRDAWAAPSRMLGLALGVALGTAALLLVLSAAIGVEDLVNRRFLGVLPDQVVVEPSAFRVGPVQMSGGPVLDDPTIARLGALPGVKAALRRVQVALPASIRAEYNGTHLASDSLVEAIDPGLVEGDLPDPGAFARRPPDQPVPVVLPAVMIDVLNMGFSVNTGLPRINVDLLRGHHFTLMIGTSSLRAGPTCTLRCEIVGISPNVGVGGPSLPIAYLEDIAASLRQAGGVLPSPQATSVTLRLRSSRDLAPVVDAVHAMGLATPQLERSHKVALLIRAVAVVLSLFALLVLLVAGTGIANGVGLMVHEEAGEIGLFRALGASRGDILLLYLSRAAFVGVVGAGAGLVLALVGSLALDRVASGWLPGAPDGSLVPLRMGPVLIAVAFALVASIVAGWVPARRAAALEPAAVLRER